MNQDRHSSRINEIYSEIDDRYKNWAEIAWGQLSIRTRIALNIAMDGKIRLKFRDEYLEISDGEEINPIRAIQGGRFKDPNDLTILHRISREIVRITNGMENNEGGKEELGKIEGWIAYILIKLVSLRVSKLAESELKGAFILERIHSMLTSSINRRTKELEKKGGGNPREDKTLMEWQAALNSLEIAIESLESRVKIYFTVADLKSKRID